jgi:urease alpha subunit
LFAVAVIETIRGKVPFVGVTERVGGADDVAVTVTAVHAPQLFVSLLSVTTPCMVALASTHIRTYHVPTAGKVYGPTVVKFAPERRVPPVLPTAKYGIVPVWSALSSIKK